MVQILKLNRTVPGGPVDCRRALAMALERTHYPGLSAPDPAQCYDQPVFCPRRRPRLLPLNGALLARNMDAVAPRRCLVVHRGGRMAETDNQSVNGSGKNASTGADAATAPTAAGTAAPSTLTTWIKKTISEKWGEAIILVILIPMAKEVYQADLPGLSKRVATLEAKVEGSGNQIDMMREHFDGKYKMLEGDVHGLNYRAAQVVLGKRYPLALLTLRSGDSAISVSIVDLESRLATVYTLKPDGGRDVKAFYRSLASRLGRDWVTLDDVVALYPLSALDGAQLHLPSDIAGGESYLFADPVSTDLRKAAMDHFSRDTGLVGRVVRLQVGDSHVDDLAAVLAMTDFRVPKS